MKIILGMFLKFVPRKVLQIFSTDLLVIRFIQSIAAFVVSYILSISVNNNPIYLPEIFFVIGMFHFIGCFYRIRDCIRVCFNVINMYLWSYILLIFVFYSHLMGMELLLIIPLWCEFWIFTATLSRSLSLSSRNWRRIDD